MNVELTTAEEEFLKAIASEWIILSAGETPAERPAGTPALLRAAVGEENEVRGAIRAILSDHATCDDAEIVYTARDPYVPPAQGGETARLSRPVARLFSHLHEPAQRIHEPNLLRRAASDIQRRGEATTIARQRAREIATLSRFRLNRESMSRGRSSPLDVAC